MNKTYTETSSRVLELIDRQTEVVSNIGCSDLNHAMSVLKDIRDVMSNYSVRVVVLGKYGSGKSSFLNAMIGHPLLPTRLPPFYEAIWEIQYAKSPSATIYPNRYSGKEPFDVRIEDLKNYIFFDRGEMTDDEKKAIVYEKIVLKYPIDTYKQNVVLAETPWLSDNYIMHEYLFSADVIIYCMRSHSPFGTTDKNVIEHLRALGHKSIIFALTYFDTVEQCDLMTGNHDAEEIRRHYISVLSPYTDFGSDGIFFISSVSALNGKMEGDMSVLKSSQLPKLEKKLEQVLDERGRIQLIKAFDSVKNANRDTRRFLLDRIESSFQNLTSSSLHQMLESKIASDISLLKDCNVILDDSDSIKNKLIIDIWHKK